MKLFIRIQNGQPVEHPIMGDNFWQAFPEIDTENLPPEFARFVRVPMPSLVYATLNNAQPSYQWVGDVVQDVWDVTHMTQEEIDNKQKIAKDKWQEVGFPSWIFNEEFCSFVPPVPHPADGKFYLWDEPTTSWIEVTNV